MDRDRPRARTGSSKAPRSDSEALWDWNLESDRILFSPRWIALAGCEDHEVGSAPADWSLWHIYYGDERCVPPTQEELNSHMAEEAWLSHVPIPPAQIHTIPNGLRADKAAEAYAQTLRGVSYFDLTLLGLGSDGHTASLCPGSD